jgi:PAS domain S-box-containing protein
MKQRSDSMEVDKLKKLVDGLGAANEKLRAELAQCHDSALAMLQSEQLLLALVSKIPVGIFATDANGNFLFVNEVWGEIAGILPEQAVGKGWVNAVHPDDRESVFKEWQTATGERQDVSYECCFRTQTGKITWV